MTAYPQPSAQLCSLQHVTPESPYNPVPIQDCAQTTFRESSHMEGSLSKAQEYDRLHKNGPKFGRHSAGAQELASGYTTSEFVLMLRAELWEGRWQYVTCAALSRVTHPSFTRPQLKSHLVNGGMQLLTSCYFMSIGVNNQECSRNVLQGCSLLSVLEGLGRHACLCISTLLFSTPGLVMH